MLELAEFLIIQNLKSLCVRYVKTIEINANNCLKLLQLSCLYGLELSVCYRYLHNHITEVLETKEAYCLTKDFVIEIFTDPHADSVTAETKFTFLTRWANASRDNETAFREVFESSSFIGMNERFLEAVVKKNPLIQGHFDNSFLHKHCNREGNKILFFSDSSEQTQLTCFDLSVCKWLDLSISVPHDPDLPVVGISKRKLKLPVIYKVDNCYGKCTLYMHKLNALSKHIKTSVIDIIAEEHAGSFSSYCVHGMDFAAVVNETVWEKRQANPDITNVTIEETNTFLVEDDVSYSNLNNSLEEDNGELAIVQHSTLFCANLEMPVTKVLPVLSIPGTTISSCCQNSRFTIALFSEELQTLYIYDKIQCQMYTVWLGQYIDVRDDYGSAGVLKLAPAGRGYILHNKMKAIVVSRVPGRWGNERYTIKEVVLEYDEHWDDIHYFYSDNTWFRFLRRTPASEMEFASVTHRQLLEDDGSELAWKELPITEEIGQISRGNQAFVIRFDPSWLGKYLNCPRYEAPKTNIIKRPLWQFQEDDLDSDLDDYCANDLWHDHDDDFDLKRKASGRMIPVMSAKQFWGFRP